MNIIIKTGFETITHNISFQPRTEIKGNKLVLAEQVRNVEELRHNGQSYLIRAHVIRQTSATLTPYKTILNINGARVVTGVKCDCVCNQSGKCKHVSALISYVNNTTSLAKTSNEQQWGKPSIRQFVQNKYSKGRYFEDMFLPVAKKKCSLVRPVTYCELAQESSLKQVLEAGEQSKHVTDIKEVLAKVLNEVESNLEQEDCVECLNTFFILRTEHES
ncbi:hypothetical protein EVAR_61057_1 [Eumeta japonica]|uniref:SWIM-type domain-containing protein n=1 Tax=Eumeta variegata TaxID=151549 RepID=A0A4C1Z949_EUMVA|nr:hypothetical protein EVAR_61057_1 [Eumeta japonica]